MAWLIMEAKEKLRQTHWLEPGYNIDSKPLGEVSKRSRHVDRNVRVEEKKKWQQRRILKGKSVTRRVHWIC